MVRLLTAVLLLSYLAVVFAAPVPAQDSAGIKSDDTSEENISFAEDYLVRFGWMNKGQRQRSSKARKKTAQPGALTEAERRSISKFQKFFGLNVTGVVDEETLALMRVPRCGMRDDAASSSTSSAARRWRIDEDKNHWGKTKLRYNIKSYSEQMDKEDEEDMYRHAFDVFTAISALQFDQVDDPKSADIHISFEVGAHGDSSPFDGAGLVLGHTFFPWMDEKGLIHFDHDESHKWKVTTFTDTGSYTETGPGAESLYYVAAHEIGHMLGLHHSGNKKSLMYSYAPDGTVGHKDKIHLGDYETKRIQKIYGESKCKFPFNGYTYRLVDASGWEDARTKCKLDGGDLAVHGMRDLDLRRTIVTNGLGQWGTAFIGMSDSAVEGRWFWLDGGIVSSNTANWQPGEPNNGGWYALPRMRENCGAVVNYGLFELKDEKCDKRMQAICEYPAEGC